MKKKIIFSVLCISLFGAYACTEASVEIPAPGTLGVGTSASQSHRSPDLFGYVCSCHWDCDSFLIRYSPYRNLMAILMIDKNNNGYVIEIYNTHTRQKIFDFEPVTMPIADFRLTQESIVVLFADMRGTQIAYDVYTGEIIWQT